MADIRFDGKVAIVTGAGGGLGRCHALELARRGAKVVVNDLGASMDGSGGSSAAADEVVKEIEALGGEAIANGSSVTDDAGVKKMIDDARNKWISLLVLAGCKRTSPGEHVITRSLGTDVEVAHVNVGHTICVTLGSIH